MLWAHLTEKAETIIINLRYCARQHQREGPGKTEIRVDILLQSGRFSASF